MHILEQVMAWYPNKRLYRRPSSKSRQDIISVYAPTARCPVYSHAEWYADDWVSPDLDVDLNTSFFEQFAKLQTIAPVVALLSNKQENAEYCHDVDRLKNCYLVFDAINCEDVYYSVRIYHSRSCIDCYWVMDSELLYDCVYVFSSYHSRYSFNCKNIIDAAFLFNCHNTRDSFMSSNLRNKQYYIRNQPYSKSDYAARMRQIDLSNPAVIAELKREFREELLPHTPIPPAWLERTEDVTGNYLRSAHHMTDGLESFEVDNCQTIFQCGQGKDITASFMCNENVERCHQSVATGINTFNVSNCAFVWNSSNIDYSYLMMSCKDCFGCIGLRNKQYHILNKPYSQHDYLATKQRLVQAMQQRGEYGQFFPMALSPFPYEDTIAYDFFADAPVVPPMKLNLIAQEKAFYTQQSIPEPTRAFPDRYRERLELMDTSFTQNHGTYFKHPETKKIVSYEEYLKALD